MGLSRDVAFLIHMLDEVRFLRSRSAGLEYNDLIEDQVLQRAFVRSLEVLGEAAKNVSADFKKAYPEVDWKRIAGLRDKLIHHYFGVDLAIIWDVIQNKLDSLEQACKKLLEKEKK